VAVEEIDGVEVLSNDVVEGLAVIVVAAFVLEAILLVEARVVVDTELDVIGTTDTVVVAIVAIAVVVIKVDDGSNELKFVSFSLL
jgi:hypothetical protein